MPRYLVNHGYRSFSDGRQFGPFTAGETVELDSAEADWVNRDSPGCLAPSPAEEPAADPADAEDEPAEEPAPQPNRQHKPARKRAAS